VKADKMKDIPAVSFKDLLQGNAPGVQFSSSSGQPGASSSLNIRGMGSFNASNSPLYVIDGIPMRSGSINTMSSDAGLDIMSTINSSDIENITIIKDAAAASLYGSRAATLCLDKIKMTFLEGNILLPYLRIQVVALGKNLWENGMKLNLFHFFYV
jgi:TonB-dependent SusC/RagA subfamily outer membrane receptor